MDAPSFQTTTSIVEMNVIRKPLYRVSTDCNGFAWPSAFVNSRTGRHRTRPAATRGPEATRLNGPRLPAAVRVSRFPPAKQMTLIALSRTTEASLFALYYERLYHCARRAH